MTNIKANKQKLIAIALLAGYLFFIILPTTAPGEAYRIYRFLETTSGRLLNRSFQKVWFLHTISRNSCSIYTASADAAVSQGKVLSTFTIKKLTAFNGTMQLQSEAGFAGPAG